MNSRIDLPVPHDAAARAAKAQAEFEAAPEGTGFKRNFGHVGPLERASLGSLAVKAFQTGLRSTSKTLYQLADAVQEAHFKHGGGEASLVAAARIGAAAQARIDQARLAGQPAPYFDRSELLSAKAAVNDLLQRGVPPAAPKAAEMKGTWTPLHHAAHHGFNDAVPLLLAAIKRYPAALEVQEKQHGHTPLAAAIEGGNRGATQLLLEAGADVNVRDRLGVTPLMLLARAGDHENFARALPRADFNVRDNKGWGAHMHAVGGNGSQDAKVAMIEGMHARGATILDSERHGFSALHLVAMSDEVRVLQGLMRAAGSNPKAIHNTVNAMTSNGDTPMHLAASNGQTKMLVALRAFGAAPDVPNRVGITATDLAGNNGHDDAQRMLRAMKAEQLAVPGTLFHRPTSGANRGSAPRP